MPNFNYFEGNCTGFDQIIEVEPDMKIDITRPVVAARRITDLHADDCYECPLRNVTCFPKVEFKPNGQNRIVAVVSPGDEDPRSTEGELM